MNKKRLFVLLKNALLVGAIATTLSACYNGPARVWVPGHWNHGYWVPGHYVVAPGRIGGPVWVPGHNNRFGVWIPGHWRY